MIALQWHPGHMGDLLRASRDTPPLTATVARVRERGEAPNHFQAAMLAGAYAALTADAAVGVDHRQPFLLFLSRRCVSVAGLRYSVGPRREGLWRGRGIFVLPASRRFE